MNITIIGLGLIGGSMAISLKEIGYSKHIIGVDINPAHRKEALRLNLVNEVKGFSGAAADSDIIIVATPVAASVKVISELLEIVTENQVIIDLGSTKKELCSCFNMHKNRGNYVSAHPIAGTENAGPTAAVSGLFRNKKVVLCEKNLSSSIALSTALELFSRLKMFVIFMNPEEHDKHLAYISHLSHISSFALGLTVLDLEKDEENIFNLAGSGFSSTARLAQSSPEMWNDIFAQNKENVLPALEAYIQHLNAFREDIINNNEKGLKLKMSSANKIREIIN